MIPDRVRELIAEAERFDGAPPISDQALLAASQGRRRILEVFPGPAGQSAVADARALGAIGILGEGELDLVV